MATAQGLHMRHVDRVSHVYWTQNFTRFKEVALSVASLGIEFEVCIQTSAPERAASSKSAWEKKCVYVLDNKSVMQCPQIDDASKRYLLAAKKVGGCVEQAFFPHISEELMSQGQLWVGYPCTGGSAVVPGDYIETLVTKRS